MAIDAVKKGHNPFLRLAESFVDLSSKPTEQNAVSQASSKLHQEVVSCKLCGDDVIGHDICLSCSQW